MTEFGVGKIGEAATINVAIMIKANVNVTLVSDVSVNEWWKYIMENYTERFVVTRTELETRILEKKNENQLSPSFVVYEIWTLNIVCKLATYQSDHQTEAKQINK